MRRAAALFVLAGVVALAGPVRGDEPAPSPVDLLNEVLTGLLGLGEVSPEVLQAEVAEIGGVEFRRPVTLDYISPDALPAYLRQVVDEEYTPAQAQADARLLVAFDLLPAGTDLRALRTRLLDENVAGFYDDRPSRKKLFAVSRERRLTPANQIILAHELRHALQDQYADLHTLLPRTVGDYDDRRLAFLSLLEGDATLVMEHFLARRLGQPPGAGGGLGAGLASPALALPDAPPVVRDQLVLPYVLGRDFADALFRAGGWEAVRRAWTDPPASTEQVLHPEKYLRREPARTVSQAWAPAGATLVDEGVLGEMLTRTLLGEGREAAAAGWGGDTYRVWDVRGATLLVWKTAWDDAREAAEFAAALRARLAAAEGERPPPGGPPGAWRAAVRVEGDAVTLVRADAPEPFAAALAGRP